MLRRTYRLRSEKDIRTVLRAGRTVRTPYVRVHLLPTNRAHSRAACVVGSRVSRSAVVRHRYQRWLRQIAQAILQGNAWRSSYDMVWYALPSITRAADYHALAQELRVALARRQL